MPAAPAARHPPTGWWARSGPATLAGMTSIVNAWRARVAAGRGRRVPELPSGTVTLLLTDIEGSTRLLRRYGRGYAELLAEHRRRIRAAIAAHHGVEADTVGDATLAAFRRAPDAVTAAADAQTALAAGPVRVRMGLHTGEPLLTDEGYVGLDVTASPASRPPATAVRSSCPRPPATSSTSPSATSASTTSRTSRAPSGSTNSATAPSRR